MARKVRSGRKTMRRKKNTYSRKKNTYRRKKNTYRRKTMRRNHGGMGMMWNPKPMGQALGDGASWLGDGASWLWHAPGRAWARHSDSKKKKAVRMGEMARELRPARRHAASGFGEYVSSGNPAPSIFHN